MLAKILLNARELGEHLVEIGRRLERNGADRAGREPQAIDELVAAIRLLMRNSQESED